MTAGTYVYPFDETKSSNRDKLQSSYSVIGEYMDQHETWLNEHEENSMKQYLAGMLTKYEDFIEEPEEGEKFTVTKKMVDELEELALYIEDDSNAKPVDMPIDDLERFDTSEPKEKTIHEVLGLEDHGSRYCQLPCP